MMALINKLENKNRSLKKMHLIQRLKAVIVLDAIEKKWRWLPVVR